MARTFLKELRRRRVPQVAGFYLAAGWMVFEVAESVFPRLGLPDWTVTFVLLLLLLAFPIVVGLAWVYDLTPDGVRRTAEEPTAPGSAEAPAGGSAPVPGAGKPGSGPGWWRVGGLAIGLGAVVVAAFLLLGGDEPEVSASPNAMAVLPFTVRGGEDVGVLAEGMVELLSAKLDGAGELRSADPQAVLAAADGAVDAEGARRVARRLGAGHYVLGSVLGFGRELRLQATIRETEAPLDAEPVAEASVEGPDTAFLALVDELAAELLTAGRLAPVGRIPRIAAMTTEELPALKQFLEGERALRQGRYADAIGRFERALEADSAFALAHYRMAVAASWDERQALVERALAAARRHEHRLSARDRALLAAVTARQEGRHAEALGRFRDIVRSYPDDLEAWYELGEVMLHAHAFLGILPAEAAEPFRRASELDPGHVAALYHLVNLGAITRDTSLVGPATRQLREVRDGGAPLGAEVQWAFLMGDSTDRTRMLDAVVVEQDQIPLLFAALTATDPDDLRRVVRASVRVDREAWTDEYMGNHLANFGLRDEALDWLAARERERSPGAPLRTAILATHPFLRTPADRLERLHEELGGWDPGPVRTEPVAPDEFGHLSVVGPQVRQYALALLDARLGRPGEAIRRADLLESMDGSPAIRRLATDLARHVRAQVHFDQGRIEEALRIIEGARFWETTEWDERLAAVFAQGGPILLRAEALHQLGRHREAIRWFSTRPLSAHAFGYSHYRRAQSHEALGEPRRAAEQYARFLEAWGDAEPDLQDRVRDARRRLEALTAEGL